MRTLGNESKVSTVTLVLVLAIAALMASMPAATAHDPPLEIPTYAYLAVTPNPVGVGENTFLIMWLHGAPPTAAGAGGDRWYDFTVEVTKPNGDTETLGPYKSDPTGSTYDVYTPDQTGTYKFVFSYSGQVLSLYHPETGIPGSYSPFINDTFLPSSATEYLTVQDEPIEKIPDYSLPTEYWTRPIEGQNSAWASIASHWLGGAHLGGYSLWQKDGTAPNTPHIMWTMPIEFGGIVGGTTDIPGVGFYSGGSYEGRFTNAIIMYGRLYFQMPLNHAGGSRSTGGGYACVDLRTGETIWISDEIGRPYTGVYAREDRPTMKGQLYDYESRNQHGVTGGIIWEVRGSTWIGYDAFTGQWIYNLTNVPSGYEVYTDRGEIVRYVLNYPERRLALWTTAAKTDSPLVLTPGTTTNAYQYRPMGKNADMSNNYEWNVSIPDLPGLSSPSIVSVIPGDLILGTSSSFPWLGGILTIQESPITMWAISDKPETRGDLLWIMNYTLPTGITRLLGPVDAETRVFTMNQIETMAWLGYSLEDGSLLWGPETYVKRAFSYYGSGTGGGQQGFAAYGNLYTQGFGGELCAISLQDGKLLWRYNNTYSGVETIWGYYPIFVAAMAEGKVYAFNNEHSPNYPLYKGEKVRCIDADTGDEIWTILGWAGQTGGVGSSTSVVAEGFLVYYNYYDNQIYCIGKGPTATTVSVSDGVIANGETVLIEGTVTDQSPGAAGTPCVSKESMGAWMEYLYMQKPCPMDTTGVPVRLEAFGADGSYIDIGTVTSDVNGFRYEWTPQDEGLYTILATFNGDESYWVSWGATGLSVGPAPEAPAEPEEEPAYTAIDLAIIAAVVVAIVIGVVNLWALRKRT